MKKTETYKYKKGQVLDLDEIYNIQGIAGGDWWDAGDLADGDAGEEVVIVKDITIRITITTPSPRKD